MSAASIALNTTGSSVRLHIEATDKTPASAYLFRVERHTSRELTLVDVLKRKRERLTTKQLRASLKLIVEVWSECVSGISPTFRLLEPTGARSTVVARLYPIIDLPSGRCVSLLLLKSRGHLVGESQQAGAP